MWSFQRSSKDWLLLTPSTKVWKTWFCPALYNTCNLEICSTNHWTIWLSPICVALFSVMPLIRVWSRCGCCDVGMWWIHIYTSCSQLLHWYIFDSNFQMNITLCYQWSIFWHVLHQHVYTHTYINICMHILTIAELLVPHAHAPFVFSHSLYNSLGTSPTSKIFLPRHWCDRNSETTLPQLLPLSEGEARQTGVRIKSWFFFKSSTHKYDRLILESIRIFLHLCEHVCWLLSTTS